MSIYIRAISIIIVSILAGFGVTQLNQSDLARYSTLTDQEKISELLAGVSGGLLGNIVLFLIVILLIVAIYEFLIKILTDLINKFKKEK